MEFRLDDLSTEGHEERLLNNSAPLLKPLRKRKSTQEQQATAESLDLNVLAIVPPHIINQLDWRQERWLAARLITYNDSNTCKHVGPSIKVVQRWLEESEAFRTVYDLVVMDRVNMALHLNRVLLVRMKMIQMQLLESNNLSVVLKVVDQISRENAAIAAAESKKGNTTNITMVGDSTFEYLRTLDQRGLITDNTRRTGSLEEELRRSGLPPIEASTVYEDQGRDHTADSGLRALAVAGGVAGRDSLEQVHHRAEGSAIRGLLVNGPVSSMDGELPSDLECADSK